jgi:hypothetical protein
MLAVCPKDRSHRLFVTEVDVVERWTVNEWGAAMKVDFLRVENGPTPDRIWLCEACGARAIVSHQHFGPRWCTGAAGDTGCNG